MLRHYFGLELILNNNLWESGLKYISLNINLDNLHYN